MQLSLNALQVHIIYAEKNAEAIHVPLQGEWIYQTKRRERWKSRANLKFRKNTQNTIQSLYFI